MLPLQSSISRCQWSQCKLILWQDQPLIQNLHNSTTINPSTCWKSLKGTKDVQTSIPVASNSRILRRKLPSTAWGWADWRHNTNEQAFSLFCFMSHDRLCGDAHRRPFWEVWPVTRPGTCMSMNKQFKRSTGSTTRYCSLALLDVAVDWYPPTASSRQITFSIILLFN